MVGLQRHQFGEIVLNDILLMKLLVLYDALLDFRYLLLSDEEELVHKTKVTPRAPP